MKFSPGETHHIIRAPLETRKIHIVSIVDKNMIVFKWYGKHKQWWHYEIMEDVFLEIEIKRGRKNLVDDGG